MSYGFVKYFFNLELEETANQEAILVKPYPLTTALSTNTLTKLLNNLEEDKDAKAYAERFNLLKGRKLLYTNGDGSCLFNAVSLALVGNESLATELRYRCCIELTQNIIYYKEHFLSQKICLVGGDINEACLDCATPSAWSTAWSMLALSTVIGRSLRSVFPPCNGTKDITYQALNFITYPRGGDEERFYEEVCIMWTRCGPLPSIKRKKNIL